jgi:D-alanyl-D-alanine carboxypeptidase/D-alanyl-D-alanine-endopeptidase (penicillin-binding protein 4)
MEHHTAGRAFRDALPVAGVDGTLSTRMLGTPAEKNVSAKTGGLRWANALSGYATTAAEERLVFAILLNRYRDDDLTRPVRVELDTIPVLLAGLRQHSRDWKP